MALGLISDTHGLLREAALKALGDCELIIHAGDIGNPDILRRLKEVAPLIAIKGNIDTADWASALSATAVAEAGGVQAYVLHNLNDLDLDPAVAGFNLVVSGHSHKPISLNNSGVLYINPGSAGPRRFKLPVTVARLELSNPSWAVTFIDLLSGNRLNI